MRFLVALRFLTIIPMPLRREVSAEEIGRSIGYFPVVGVVIGLILAAINWLLGLLLPPAVVNVLLIVSLIVLTGALHLDGVADTCDGIGGHKSAEARWQAMQDSRAGGFGIVGVSGLLLVKYVSLNSVPETLVMATLLLMPVLSRWTMVFALFSYPYAKPSGLGKAFKQEANWQKLLPATVVALAVATILFRLAGLAIMAGVWVIVAALAAYLKRRFSGLTGDTYGAINEVAEVGVLILVGLLAHQQWLGLA